MATLIGAQLKGFDGKAMTHTWTLSDNESGEAIESPHYVDRSVQVAGSLGGGTVTLQGSNDGSNYEVLTDATGAVLSFTASGLKQVLQVTRYIKPVITGATSPDVQIILLGVSK